MSFFDVVFRPLNQAGNSFIDMAREEKQEEQIVLLQDILDNLGDNNHERDYVNENQSLLLAGETFVGQYSKYSGHASGLIVYASFQPFTASLSWSSDGINADTDLFGSSPQPVEFDEDSGYYFFLNPMENILSNYMRVEITNGVEDQTAGIISLAVKRTTPLVGSITKLSDAISITTVVQNTRAVITGQVRDDSNVLTNSFNRAQVNTDGALIVSNPYSSIYVINSSTNGVLPSGSPVTIDGSLQVAPITAANVYDSGWLPYAKHNNQFAYLKGDTGLTAWLLNSQDDQGSDLQVLGPSLVTSANSSRTIQAPFFQAYFRVIIQNTSGVDATKYEFRSLGGDIPLAPIYQSLDQLIVDEFPAPLSMTVGKAKNPNGIYDSIRKDGRDDTNSTFTALNGDTGGTDHIYRGSWFPWQGSYVGMVTEVESDVSGHYIIDFSTQENVIDGDESSVSFSIPRTYDPTEGFGVLRRHTPVQSKWVRVRYINGTTAQTYFSIDTSFLTNPAGSVLEALTVVPAKEALSGIERVKPFTENAAGEHDWVKRGGAGEGLDVHITGNDAQVSLSGVGCLQTKQVTLTTDPVRIDEPVVPISGTRQIHITNIGVFHAFIKESSMITENNSRPLFLGGDATFLLEEGEEIWGICEDTGGVTQITPLQGVTSGGTATSPSLALSSNDQRAIQSAVGQTITTYDYSLTPTLTDIDRLRIGWEGRKDPAGSPQPLTIVQSVGDVANNSNSVISPSLNSGSDLLYIVSVSRNATNSVSGISGGGLTYTPIRVDVESGGRHTDMWWGYGNPTAGSVTAQMSSLTDAVISVLSISGSDGSAPIFDSEQDSGSGTTSTTPSLDTQDGSLVIMASGHENSDSGTAGGGYTERTDNFIGTGSNRVTLGVETKAIVSAGSETPTYNFSNSTWSAISVTISAGPPINPTTELSYEYNGVAGQKKEVIPVVGTTDYTRFVDITEDFGEIFVSDIPLIKTISTCQSVGTANIETDTLFLEVRETSGAITRVSVQQGGC